MGDAHNAAYVAVVHVHHVEDEKDGVLDGLGSVFLLGKIERGEVEALLRTLRGTSVSFVAEQ